MMITPLPDSGTKFDREIVVGHGVHYLKWQNKDNKAAGENPFSIVLMILGPRGVTHFSEEITNSNIIAHFRVKRSPQSQDEDPSF